MTVNDLGGQTLGQYELRELLGMGGMGAVYRAYQASLSREVAVKVLPAALAADSTFIARFNREAKTAAALEHPHIVPIHDYGVQDGISYVVMRLLTGGSLKDRLNAALVGGGQLPAAAEVSRLLNQLAGALDYAHSQGVVHRDIKPANVMFDQRGDAYLVDFGIAKLMQQATQSLTADSAIMGTPAFMAPEQWLGQPITPAADQYALGALAYTYLTGRQPFDSPTPYALMHMHTAEPVPPPQTYRADIPLALNPVLERALAKSADSRYPSVGAFAADFERAVSAVPDQTPLVIRFDPEGEGTRALPERAKTRVSSRERATPVPPAAEASSANRRHYGLVMVVIVLVTVAVAVLMLSRSGAPDGAPLPTLAVLPTLAPTESDGVAAAVQTANTAAQPVVVASSTATPASAAVASASATITRTHTPTVTPSLTATSTRTPIPTRRPTRTPTVEPTVSAAAYFNLGVEAAANGDYAQAVAYFDFAIGLNPGYAQAYYQRGAAYYALGNLDAAFNDFSSAIQLNPNDAAAYISRGQVLLDWGDPAQAIADLSQGLDLNPGDADGFFLRGLAYAQLEDYG